MDRVQICDEYGISGNWADERIRPYFDRDRITKERTRIVDNVMTNLMFCDSNKNIRQERLQRIKSLTIRQRVIVSPDEPYDSETSSDSSNDPDLLGDLVFRNKKKKKKPPTTPQHNIHQLWHTAFSQFPLLSSLNLVITEQVLYHLLRAIPPCLSHLTLYIHSESTKKHKLDLIPLLQKLTSPKNEKSSTIVLHTLRLYFDHRIVHPQWRKLGLTVILYTLRIFLSLSCSTDARMRAFTFFVGKYLSSVPMIMDEKRIKAEIRETVFDIVEANVDSLVELELLVLFGQSVCSVKKGRDWPNFEKNKLLMKSIEVLKKKEKRAKDVEREHMMFLIHEDVPPSYEVDDMIDSLGEFERRFLIKLKGRKTGKEFFQNLRRLVFSQAVWGERQNLVLKKMKRLESVEVFGLVNFELLYGHYDDIINKKRERGVIEEGRGLEKKEEERWDSKEALRVLKKIRMERKDKRRGKGEEEHYVPGELSSLRGSPEVKWGKRRERKKRNVERVIEDVKLPVLVRKKEENEDEEEDFDEDFESIGEKVCLFDEKEEEEENNQANEIFGMVFTPMPDEEEEKKKEEEKKEEEKDVFVEEMEKGRNIESEDDGEEEEEDGILVSLKKLEREVEEKTVLCEKLEDEIEVETIKVEALFLEEEDEPKVLDVIVPLNEDDHFLEGEEEKKIEPVRDSEGYDTDEEEEEEEDDDDDDELTDDWSTSFTRPRSQIVLPAPAVMEYPTKPSTPDISVDFWYDHLPILDIEKNSNEEEVEEKDEPDVNKIGNDPHVLQISISHPNLTSLRILGIAVRDFDVAVSVDLKKLPQLQCGFVRTLECGGKTKNMTNKKKKKRHWNHVERLLAIGNGVCYPLPRVGLEGACLVHPLLYWKKNDSVNMNKCLTICSAVDSLKNIPHLKSLNLSHVNLVELMTKENKETISVLGKVENLVIRNTSLRIADSEFIELAQLMKKFGSLRKLHFEGLRRRSWGNDSSKSGKICDVLNFPHLKEMKIDDCLFPLFFADAILRNTTNLRTLIYNAKSHQRDDFLRVLAAPLSKLSVDIVTGEFQLDLLDEETSDDESDDSFFDDSRYLPFVRREKAMKKKEVVEKDEDKVLLENEVVCPLLERLDIIWRGYHSEKYIFNIVKRHQMLKYVTVENNRGNWQGRSSSDSFAHIVHLTLLLSGSWRWLFENNNGKLEVFPRKSRSEDLLSKMPIDEEKNDEEKKILEEKEKNNKNDVQNYTEEGGKILHKDLKERCMLLRKFKEMKKLETLRIATKDIYSKRRIRNRRTGPFSFKRSMRNMKVLFPLMEGYLIELISVLESGEFPKLKRLILCFQKWDIGLNQSFFFEHIERYKRRLQVYGIRCDFQDYQFKK